MSTQLSIHYVTDVTARHYPDIPSLTISFHTEGAISPHEVVLFCNDVVLNARLVEAINTVARQRAEEKAAEQKAADDAFFEDEEDRS